MINLGMVMAVATTQLMCQYLKTGVKNPAKITAMIYGAFTLKKWNTPSHQIDSDKVGENMANNLKMMTTKLDKASYGDIETLGKEIVEAEENKINTICSTITIVIIVMCSVMLGDWIRMITSVFGYVSSLMANRMDLFMHFIGALTHPDIITITTHAIVLGFTWSLDKPYNRWLSYVVSWPTTLVAMVYRISKQ